MKLIIEIDDNGDIKKARALINAIDMELAINTYYDKIIRPILKYQEHSQDVLDVVEQIHNELNMHFKDFLND